MSRFGKKKIQSAAASIELNIMPFIDVFSLLCTFLLFSAVFVSVGIQMVQVPFLSNATVTKEESQRSLNLKVDASLQKTELQSSWSEPPTDAKTQAFATTSDGYKEFHQALLKIKQDNPETDKVNLFIDNDVGYEQIVLLLDLIKLRGDGDPAPPAAHANSSMDLFPKVVFGSVIL